jgi:putative ABC transport system permease protein
MLSIISWRNVWRNKGRTLVVVGAIILGVWALTFTLSFMRTFVVNYVDNAIKEQYAHMQIHFPDFRMNQDIHLDIPDGENIAAEIREYSHVEGASPRIIMMGMIASAKTTSGAQIFGVVPEEEKKVFELQQSVIEGTYFEETLTNPAVIGKELADKLNLGVKSRAVLTFVDKEGNLVHGAFRVAGIFDSSSPILDPSAVYLLKSDMERLLNVDELVHQIAIRLTDQDQIKETQQTLAARFPNLEVQNWKELAPELDLIISQSMTSLYFLIGIIVLALAFGIVNTMLMAVLERTKELAMLMAIGMKKIRVFSMVILETVMIAIVGGPIGLLLGYITIQTFYHRGLDLSIYSEGLEQYGFDSILYLRLEVYYYFVVVSGVISTAIMAAVYPAFKAIQLKPAEALHKI